MTDATHYINKKNKQKQNKTKQNKKSQPSEFVVLLVCGAFRLFSNVSDLLTNVFTLRTPSTLKTEFKKVKKNGSSTSRSLAIGISIMDASFVGFP